MITKKKGYMLLILIGLLTCWTEMSQGIGFGFGFGRGGWGGRRWGGWGGPRFGFGVGFGPRWGWGARRWGWARPWGYSSFYPSYYYGF